MAKNRYIDIKITRQTRPVSQRGFGIPLVLATSKNLPYKIYKNDNSVMEAVAEDFSTDTAEYRLFDRMFSQEPAPAEIAVYGVSYDKEVDSSLDLVDALNDLILENHDFYYLVSPEQGDDEITALAEWISDKDKFYVATTSNVELAEELKELYENVHIMVYDQPELYPAEGLVAHLAPQTIGSYTWTFKTIKGVPPAKYDDVMINRIHEANASTYISEGGANITSNGRVCNGEFADVIQGQHFIKAEMTKNVFGLLTKMPKVPYSNDGIGLVVAEMKKALNTAGDNGILAGEPGSYEYTIEIPDVSEISFNDKAERVLPDIPWTATIQGAIEKVNINGVLSI